MTCRRLDFIFVEEEFELLSLFIVMVLFLLGIITFTLAFLLGCRLRALCFLSRLGLYRLLSLNCLLSTKVKVIISVDAKVEILLC